MLLSKLKFCNYFFILQFLFCKGWWITKNYEVSSRHYFFIDSDTVTRVYNRYKKKWSLCTKGHKNRLQSSKSDSVGFAFIRTSSLHYS